MPVKFITSDELLKSIDPEFDSKTYDKIDELAKEYTTKPWYSDLVRSINAEVHFAELAPNLNGYFDPKSKRVFVDPTKGDMGQVLETITHELIHAGVNQKGGPDSSNTLTARAAKDVPEASNYSPVEFAARMGARRRFNQYGDSSMERDRAYAAAHPQEAASFGVANLNPSLPQPMLHFKSSIEDNFIQSILRTLVPGFQVTDTGNYVIANDSKTK